MNNRIIWLFVFLIIVGVMLVSYFSNPNKLAPSVPEQINALYTKFIHAGLEGDNYTFVNLQHFEIPEMKELTEVYFIPVQNWEIIKWEKLSSELWVVESNIQTSDDWDSGTYYHFVGLIDGQYYIMVSTVHIPSELKDNLDVSRYDAPDSIHIEDIIK